MKNILKLTTPFLLIGLTACGGNSKNDFSCIGEARHSDMTYETEILIQGNKLLLGKNKVKQEFTIGSEVIKVDDATIRYPKDAEDGENPNESYWVMDLSTCVVTYDN